MRDLVIILPGIMGSVLERDAKRIWDPGPGFLRAFLGGQGWIDQLALPDDDPIDIGLASDGVKPVAVVNSQSIVPGMSLIDGYSELGSTVVRAFGQGIVEGDPDAPGRRLDGRPSSHGPPNFYRFAYDWRRDNRASAVRLDELIRPALEAWRMRSPQARVTLIGHSMGGLVARYWLEGTDPRTGEDFEGWREVSELLTFGTPHRGSLDAVTNLVKGKRIPLLGNFAETMGTFPSIHQLLPRYPCVRDDRSGDNRSGGNNEWHYPKDLDLPGIRAASAHAAYTDFHYVIQEGAERHSQDTDYRKDHLVPVVGFGHDTENSLTLTDDGLTASHDAPTYLDAEYADGDGTVPLVSAIPLELDDRRSQVRYVNQRHGSLQTDMRVLNAEIIMRIAQTNKSTLGAASGTGPSHLDRPQVSVNHPVLWSTDEPSVLTVTRLVGPDSVCRVVVKDLGGSEVASLEMELGDEWRPALAQGEYRVDVNQGPLQTSSGFVVIDGPVR